MRYRIFSTARRLCPSSQEDQDAPFVFARHCSGIKLAPSNLLIHTSKPLLIRRSKEVGESTQYDQVKQKWFSGQHKPPSHAKITDAVKAALKTAASEGTAKIYAYRPFLHLFALLNSGVLQALKDTDGSGTRPRPEILRAFEKTDVVGIAVAPSPKELSGSLRRFASFCWGPPDNDLSRRGSVHIFCNFFPENKKLQEKKVGPARSNVNQSLMRALGLNNDSSGAPETAVTFYCYAVLSSQWFLDRFEGALFSVGSWPRIPFPKDPSVFEKLLQLGRRLAELEKPGVVSAKKPIIPEWQDFKLTKAVPDTKTGSILFFSGKKLAYTISSVEKEVLGFEIAGYCVLQEWLKFHTYPYSRNTFKKRDAEEAYALVDKIRGQIQLSAEVDKAMSFAEEQTQLLVPAPVSSATRV